MMQGTQSWCSVMTQRDGMRREVEGQLKKAGGGAYVYLWLTHVDVWQKPSQYCRTIILQLKIKKSQWGNLRNNQEPEKSCHKNRAHGLGSPKNWWLEGTHIFKGTLGTNWTTSTRQPYEGWAAWTSSVLIFRQEFRHVGADRIWLVTQKS